MLDRAKLDALFAAAGLQRRGLYIFSTERGADDATAYSRLLGGAGAIEDPATGSAAGPAGCFMAKYGFVAPDRAGQITFLQWLELSREWAEAMLRQFQATEDLCKNPEQLPQ